MKIENLESRRQLLENQYNDTNWIENSGLSLEELQKMAKEFESSMEGQSKAVIKAKVFELVTEKGQIAIVPEDIFQDKLNAVGIMLSITRKWLTEYYKIYAPEDLHLNDIGTQIRSHYGHPDFGHTSVNTKRLLTIGIDGLYSHAISQEAKKTNPTAEQKDFYTSVKIVLSAFKNFILRLSDAVKDINPDCCKCLKNISGGAPSNIYEALQLIVIHFRLHEYIAGTRVRTLGRLDDMLYPFYKNDIESGRFTKDEIKEILKYFLLKLWAMKVPFDLPFELSGIDCDGNEVTNELSYLIVEAYMELDIYSPKIHIRVSDKTPKEFVKLVLSSIRAGKSSFVFGNDNVVIKALTKVGIAERDAKDYTFIGCYEPAVYAHEIGCTGNGGVNSVKAVEYVITRGTDLKTRHKLGIDTGIISTFEEFVSAIKAQMQHMTEECLDRIRRVEGHYMEINPDPIMSSMLEECVESGVDAYKGGARYNNSSLYLYHIASLVDSVCAVKKLVFDEKLLSFDQLCEILKADWEGHEKLRLKALKLSEKYGNGNALADTVTVDFSKFFASVVNGKPNGRGGVFKASNFSIDRYVPAGAATMATPDGRHAGDLLSKNLSPTTGMDKKGITSLIDSVTKIDFTDFANGSVLDIILHPSAVSGEDGLEAMYGILKTFFKKGGFAMHGNVFNADTLKKAQADPQKYSTLQVRVCGWNAYFVNLSKAEQDDFIKKAETI